ncbi:MAG: glycosyltransferase family 2 protein [Acidobacteria bacterium]|uniref:Glycosyltransferase family 2 protein n=1 Tax=Candidatus Polarisedimenticola svalbardensis TaxID=2886004 RepID=A0A8J7C1E0_9BACT|nr:glycosyltransferase family 2 protein [Candidatus Polarisedimenticola svalbardensis]
MTTEPVEHPDGISIVVPVFNERDNLEPLVREIEAAVSGLGRWYEIILVNDGSTDGSREIIRKLQGERPTVRGLHFRANAGQTAALDAGFQAAAGGIIITLDADLQNDPADIPALLEALASHTAAVGYRAVRNDNWLRKVSSVIANGIRNGVSGDRIRDTGCSLKVFRAGPLRRIPLYKGMHRFLPTLLRMDGGTVVELPVSHRPRLSGDSKYGIRNRALGALVDLLAVRWMKKRKLDYEVTEDER